MNKITKKNLAEFASDLLIKRACKVCLLPEAKELAEAKAGGILLVTMFKWLQEVQGHTTISYDQLRRHFLNNHHLKS